MSEQPIVDKSTGDQPPSRPGLVAWGLAGAALVSLIAFMILH